MMSLYTDHGLATLLPQVTVALDTIEPTMYRDLRSSSSFMTRHVYCTIVVIGTLFIS